MLTKGIIKSINYESNEGTVRVPLFETASQHEEFVSNAVFSIVPGIYNSYKVGDVVWVEFENNSLETAVILGKLYVDSKEENNSFRGAVSIESLNVSKNATLPVSTTLSWDAKDDTVVGVDGDFSTYKNIGDILKRVKTTEDAVSDAQVQIINNGEEVGARVTKLEEDNVEHAAELKLQSKEINARVTTKSPDKCEGFGWSMDEKGIVFESALGRKKEGSEEYVEDKTEVLKIDANGATVTGKLTVKDKEKPNPNIIFEADPFGKLASGEEKEIKPHVLIGGWDADHNSLGLIDENGKRLEIGNPNGVTIASGINDKAVAIANSDEKDDWCFVASDKFGVDKKGKVYTSDINVDGIEFDTAYYSEGVDATLSFRYGRSGHPQPEEVIDGIDVVSSTNDSNADITIWIKANIIRGATELSNSINCVVSYAWGEWTEDDDGNKHFDKNKIFYESKNVILSAKGIPQDPQPFTNYVLVASNKPNSFLIKESVKLSVTEISTRTGNFINRRGFFVDSNNNHTSGYLFNLTPNSYAGEDNVGNEFTVKWFSDSKTEIEYDSTITLNNGNFMRVYLPSTEFKQLTSASISFHHDVDEKDTSGKEYVYEYARTNLPKFSIGKIDYSKVFSDGVIIIDIVISGLGDNETYIPKYSDCITLHVSGSNELVWETAETEKLCSITRDRSNPNVSISNANNAITLKIDGNILGITHLYFSVEAIIDGEKKDIFKSASNIGLVYDSNTRSYNLSGQLNITTLASGWCVVKASCKYLKAKMA